MQGFYYVTIKKNAIMFTVANQKAIVFHFYPSIEAMTFKAHTLGVYFI